jgi:hypothetical protein
MMQTRVFDTADLCGLYHNNRPLPYKTGKIAMGFEKHSPETMNGDSHFTAKDPESSRIRMKTDPDLRLKFPHDDRPFPRPNPMEGCKRVSQNVAQFKGKRTCFPFQVGRLSNNYTYRMNHPPNNHKEETSNTNEHLREPSRTMVEEAQDQPRTPANSLYGKQAQFYSSFDGSFQQPRDTGKGKGRGKVNSGDFGRFRKGYSEQVPQGTGGKYPTKTGAEATRDAEDGNAFRRSVFGVLNANETSGRAPRKGYVSREQSARIEADLNARLSREGLMRRDVPSNGDCFYLALADQLALPSIHRTLTYVQRKYIREHFGDWETASIREGGDKYYKAAAWTLRQTIADFQADQADLLPFVIHDSEQPHLEENDRTLESYVQMTRKGARYGQSDGWWAGQHQLVSATNMLGVNIVCYNVSNELPFRFATESTTTPKIGQAATTLRLCFLHGHYQSVVPTDIASEGAFDPDDPGVETEQNEAACRWPNKVSPGI